MNAKLAIPPTTVENFVKYKEDVLAINSQMERINNLSTDITGLTIIIEDQRIRVPESYKSKVT